MIGQAALASRTQPADTFRILSKFPSTSSLILVPCLPFVYFPVTAQRGEPLDPANLRYSAFDTIVPKVLALNTSCT